MGFTDKRIRSLMTRILVGVEHLIRCDFDDINEEEDFVMKGEDILMMRNLILDAANDTIRSLSGDDIGPDKIRFERKTFPIFKYARLEFDDDPNAGDVPVITMRGDVASIQEIRDKIGIGLVYNEDGYTFYTCSGLDDIVYNVIPFLDKARIARIEIGNGGYAAWRNKIAKMYRGLEE